MGLKAFIKMFVPNVILKKRADLLSQMRNFKTLAITYNQYQSIKRWECIDLDGYPIPWYTYPAVEFLSNLDFTQKTILEWGSGNSSLFWATKAKEVISIEHDKQWFSQIVAKCKDNQRLYLKDCAIDSIESMDFVGGG